MPDPINYSSLEWMPKSVWGPILWKQLHWRAKVALPLGEEQAWFGSFMASLPCEKCRSHFSSFVLENPPDFSTREAFFRWTVMAHNAVNEATGKPVLTLEEARAAHSEPEDPKET